jgi:hypothetical protein
MWLFSVIVWSSMLVNTSLPETLAATSHESKAVNLMAAQRSCSLGSPATYQILGIQVRQHRAEPGDAAYFEVHVTATGATSRLYYEPKLRVAAQSKAACFGALLSLLAPLVPDDGVGVTWMPLYLTNAEAVSPDRLRGMAVRLKGRKWDQQSLETLLRVVPHEEVHDSQKRQRATSLPRWFQEGHAELAGLSVTDLVQPDLARKHRADIAAAAARLQDAALGRWGGIRVKPAAIRRQLTPEDRARKAADPTYEAHHMFKFSKSDYEQDLSNEDARYGASLALFEELQQRHGRAAMLRWIGAVMADEDNTHIVPLAQATFAEDIKSHLD